jgi:hypothetical protein
MAGTATRTSVLAAAVAVLLAGCWQSYGDFSDAEDRGGGEAGLIRDADAAREADVDAEVDVPVEADVVHEAEADARIDVDVGHEADFEAEARTDTDVVDDDGSADADGGGDATTCDGVWVDPTTGYLWENAPPDINRTWDDAVAHCNGLTLCGYGTGSWRLPDIDELRSLVRRCPETMTGGACGATDACLDRSCWSTACVGCRYVSHSYCYWDGPPGALCDWYWSSSSCSDAASDVWLLGFSTGRVNYSPRRSTMAYVLCVHRGS